ncbi:MAG TPA: ABC transporter permease, partial [Paracoccaceae bacterium]|nr:ABC transporter permease [Paracoccaceae bacterium]
MSAIFRAFSRELAAIFGDRQILSLMVLSLAVYAAIYPYPYRPELLRDVPVAVVDLDGSSASRQLIQDVDASEAVAVIAHPPNMIEAERLVQERRAYGVLLV